MKVQPADPARSRIVLVGASAYDDPDLPDVPQVTRNLADLVEVFTDPGLGGFPAEHVVAVPEDASVPLIGRALDDAAAKAEDLLLFYFCGHGLVADDGELLLALKDTHERTAGYSALPYETVRKTFVSIRTKARNRAVIIDSCFSGRAIGKALAGPSALIGKLAISGSYTLTSAPPTTESLVLPDEPHTAFTGRLLDFLRHGSDEDAEEEYLGLGMIYRHLLDRMTAEGLPQPQARTVARTDLLGLVRNARPIEPAPIPEDIRLLLDHRLPEARRAGVEVLGEWLKGTDQHENLAARRELAGIAENDTSPQIAEAARSLLDVVPEAARPLVVAEPEAALSAVRTKASPESPERFSAPRIAQALQTAEESAYSITDVVAKAEVLAIVAGVQAELRPDHATALINQVEALLDEIPSRPAKAYVLVMMAKAIAPIRGLRATRLVDRALRTVDGLTLESAGGWNQLAYLAETSMRLAELDSARSADPLAAAEQLARGMRDPGARASALAGMCEPVAYVDAEQALRLAEEAEKLVRYVTIVERKWLALALIAAAFAGTDLPRADATADTIEIAGYRACALALIAKVVTMRNPHLGVELAEEALRLAATIPAADEKSRWGKQVCLGTAAPLLAATAPEQAERLAASIEDPEVKAKALAEMARVWLAM